MSFYNQGKGVDKGNLFYMIDDLRNQNQTLRDRILILSKEISNLKTRNRFLVDSLKGKDGIQCDSSL